MPWPQELLSKKIPEARLITYGYNADIVHFIKPVGQNTVREHARNLAGDLTDLRRRTSSLQRHLIFVAHSLGGLVCEQVDSSCLCLQLLHLSSFSRASLTFIKAVVLSTDDLEIEHQLSETLHGIIFLGTPHAGSDLSKFALALGYFIKFSLVKSPNTSNIAVLKKDSEVLAAIQDAFSVAIAKRERLERKPVQIHCCIEENPVQGLERVSEHPPGLHRSPLIPI